MAFTNLTLQLRRSLSSADVAKQIKPFSKMPGVSKPLMFVGLFTNDLTKQLEQTPKLRKAYGDIVRIQVPFRDPIVMIFDPELAEKVYRASGPQPHRPGFFALDYVRRQDPLTNRGSVGLLSSKGEEWHQFR